jgi:hypothetical protein
VDRSRPPDGCAARRTAEKRADKLAKAYRNGISEDTRRAFRWLGENMPGDLFNALVKQFTDDGAGYTVAGYWDGNDPVVIAVIPGRHPVDGGEAPTEEGLWATYAAADSIEDAEAEAVAEMRENNRSQWDDEDVE